MQAIEKRAGYAPAAAHVCRTSSGSATTSRRARTSTRAPAGLPADPEGGRDFGVVGKLSLTTIRCG